MKFDERKLYQKILRGDEFALKELMNHYKQPFYIWASQRFNNLGQNEYEDAFAEAIIQFYEKINKGQFEYRNLSKIIDANEGVEMAKIKEGFQNSTIKTYLFHLAKNRLLNELAKKKVRINHQENVSLYIKNNNSRIETDELLVSKERSVLVKKLLDKLPSKYKKILVLSFFKNYSMESIANELGLLNADVAKSTKYKAIKALYKMMESTYKLEDFSLDK